MTTIYHYCSTSTFFSIIKNKSIWLSSLSLSNDSMEGKIASSILEKLFKNETKDNSWIDALKEATSFYENIIDGLGFCLSENGDLLSQWRGYAEDGSGFSIGFSKEYLDSITVSDPKSGTIINKVIYDKKKQEVAVLPVYEKLKEIITSGKLEFPHRRMGMLLTETEAEYETRVSSWKEARTSLYNALLPILPNMYALKNSAFREEREHRLISFLIKADDPGCLYRTNGKKIIPYKELSISTKKINPITEIIVGPKCETPINVLRGFLFQNGFTQTQITLSSATYR